ncbi:MAG: hypothetical protein ABW090_17270 [Sedimenticola sp.]
MNPAPFIALSLLLMLGLGVLTIFLAGKDSKSSNMDDPENRKDRKKFFKRF